MSFIVAAPSSGAGKTTVTLGILRALHRRGVPVRGAKSGPDYIDPQFHAAACGQTCVNLDAWAMTPDRIRSLAVGPETLIVEGAMGLFDGAPPDGKGATADLARILNLPVILVVDAAGMSHSIAAVVAGFANHDPNVKIAGIILNRVGSSRHLDMLKAALAPIAIPIVGALMRNASLSRPSRHLGLVQADEMPDLASFLEEAANVIELSVDLDLLISLGRPVMPGKTPRTAPQKVHYDRIAVAYDVAFAFAYPHQIAMWKSADTTILPFSPLANDTVPSADLIFLPGGYPELHATKISQADAFLNSLRIAAETTEIYGECGGYMTLGETLVDADGTRHQMAGLLKLDTSFASRKLHLGYRNLTNAAGAYKGHEFHYATTVRAEGTPLFEVTDAEGSKLPPMGLRDGNVSGSFAHIIEAV